MNRKDWAITNISQFIQLCKCFDVPHQSDSSFAKFRDKILLLFKSNAMLANTRGSLGDTIDKREIKHTRSIKSYSLPPAKVHEFLNSTKSILVTAIRRSADRCSFFERFSNNLY